jgi:tRNA(adenine34) deaminase
MTTDERYMEMALAEACAAGAAGEVPVGAVLLAPDGAVLARAGNAAIREADPTAHAEIRAIRAACAAAGTPRLPGTTLYTTLEPCAMCAAAISFARIARVVWGADDPKGGAVVHGPRFFAQPTCHHRPAELRGGVLAAACGAELRAFFRARRGGR